VSLSLDRAITALADAVSAAGQQNAPRTRDLLRLAATQADIFIDVSGDTPGSLRLVQEYALTAAKALCTVRSPPALRPDHSHDARERAAFALQAAWEVLHGRRAA
jgi:hypothetical protein